MKIGIMQPYFLPYIGYWQLMNAVDKYVIYDDVNYITRGWINRNRILIDGKPKYLNIPIINASQNKKINEIHILQNSKLILKQLRMVEYAYRRAPYYNEVLPLIEQILTYKENNFVPYIENSFHIISDYLEIKTIFVLSSSLNKDCRRKGQEKILDICELLDATEYYNAIGGQHLYSFHTFKQRGIDLKFLQTDDIVYRQFQNEFQKNLSIIDIMMFNSKEEIKDYLNRYKLVNEFLE